VSLDPKTSPLKPYEKYTNKNMAELISCLEHDDIPISAHRTVGQKALLPKHLELLGRLEKILPAGAFTRGHHKIKWSQYCGVVKLDDITLEILPKIYGLETDRYACRQALIKMLAKARLLQSHRIGQADIHVQRHSLLDVFILQFCDELQQQLVQGMIREYVNREENLPVLRGRLLISQQFKYNLAHKERLYCRYDELCEDILINRIIRHTLKLLFSLASSELARKAVIGQLHSFENISDQIISIHDFTQITYNRNTTRYENIITQCKMFIQGLNPDVLAGKHSTCSLLFDMNKLFESWVAAELRPEAWKQNLKLREQGPRRYMAQWQDNEQPVFQMKPDISLIDAEDNVVRICDAKWKILNQEETKLGISQADLYQLQAYANRYGVRDLSIFYPMQKDLTKLRTLHIKGVHESTIRIVPVDITSQTGMAIHESPLRI